MINKRTITLDYLKFHLFRMARIWRHGQKLPVFIYRFLASGTIEEHIYQRQSFKKQLSDSVIEQQTDSESECLKFSVEELKRIMVYRPDVDSLTHDKICSSKACDVKEHLCRPFDARLEDHDIALGEVSKRVTSISFVLA